MPYTVLCVGKARERFFSDAVAEYQKRLTTLCPCQIIEVADEPEPKQLSTNAIEQVKRREAERLLARIPAQAYVVALTLDGREYESEAFAAHLGRLFSDGHGELAFLIGGSLGLHESALRRANERLCLGKLTLPHQLARVVLLEQLYRAAKINAGQRYHK